MRVEGVDRPAVEALGRHCAVHRFRSRHPPAAPQPSAKPINNSPIRRRFVMSEYGSGKASKDRKLAGTARGAGTGI